MEALLKEFKISRKITEQEIQLQNRNYKILTDFSYNPAAFPSDQNIVKYLLDDDFDPEKSKGLGLNLVKILTTQLGGKFSFSSDNSKKIFSKRGKLSGK